MFEAVKNFGFLVCCSSVSKCGCAFNAFLPVKLRFAIAFVCMRTVRSQYVASFYLETPSRPSVL